MQRILGIDPGLVATGYAVIQSDGQKHELLTSGVVRGRGSLSVRLSGIYDQLNVVLQEYKPQVSAIENIFFAKDPVAGLKLGQARGVAICVLSHQHIPIFEYSSRSVKKAVVGHGSANKQQVGFMVARLLNMQNKWTADESDAIAIALCHTAHAGHKPLLQAQKTGQQI